MAGKVRTADVVGVKEVSYTRKTGEFVTGQEVYFTFEDDSIKGFGVGSSWASSREFPGGFHEGGRIQVFHDDFRRTFTLIPPQVMR